MSSSNQISTQFSEEQIENCPVPVYTIRMKVPIPRDDNHLDGVPKSIPNGIVQARSPARLPPGVDNHRRLTYVRTELPEEMVVQVT